MPDSVKISELSPRAAVGTDVLPAVDATFNSTVRVSASSIAAIGGGPPGDGTVTTAKIANNAVTLGKLATLPARTIIGNNTGSTATPVAVPCTDAGLSILNGASYAAIRSLLDTSSVFTGQITFSDGTAAAPSIANTGNTNTGLYWPENNTVGISTEGSLKFYIDGEGTQYSNIAEQVSVIRPQYSCRAWVAFNGSTSTTTTISSQATIAQRYGRSQSLFFDGWSATTPASNGLTVARIVALELANGNEMTNVGTTAADGRNNYTSPGDNTHWRWTGSAWTTIAATGNNWIGNISFKPSANAAIGILAQGGVSSVTINGTGQYRVTFSTAMPDTNYAVVIGSRRVSFASAGGDDVVTRTTTYCDVRHVEATVVTNTAFMSLAIFR